MVEQKIKFFKFQGKWIKQVPVGDDDDSCCKGCIGHENEDLCKQLPDCRYGKDAVQFKTLSTEEHQLFGGH